MMHFFSQESVVLCDHTRLTQSVLLHDDTSCALGFAEKQANSLPNRTAVFVACDKGSLAPWKAQLANLIPAKITFAAVDEALDHIDSTPIKTSGDNISGKRIAPDVFVLVMDCSENPENATFASHTKITHHNTLQQDLSYSNPP